MITQKILKSILSYSEDTGDFIWLSTSKGKTAGKIAGGFGYGYRRIMINYISYQAHRLSWLYVYGEWPDKIDHINHDRADNRIENLRSVSVGINNKNKRIGKNNTSGVTGVYFIKKRNIWLASIRVEYKHIKLLYSADKFEAICARKSAEIKCGFHINHGR